MDYNYVRMRNAKAAGDELLADHYKKLCEKEPEKPEKTNILVYVIILLAVIVAALGGYIVFFGKSAGTVEINACIVNTILNIGGFAV